MRPGRLSRLTLAGTALAVVLIAAARAEEPSSRELIALAPTLDSSDRDCQSLDFGGWFGADTALNRNLRFRALYRTPNQFSLFICDGVDGTPLAFCSGRKALFYDPVGPTVYYSENAGFHLAMAVLKNKLSFDFGLQLVGGPPDHFLVDFRSMLSLTGQAAVSGPFEDRVVKRNTSQFELVTNFDKSGYLKIDIDLSKKCPYTEAALVDEGVTVLRLDRIALNSALGDEPFTFPSKQRLTRALPVKDVTTEKDAAALRDLSAVVGRGFFVRAVMNSNAPSRLITIPELQGLDLDRVRENDKKFARALQGLVPPRLRVHTGELREAAGAKSRK
jgi:hypothetical protein